MKDFTKNSLLLLTVLIWLLSLGFLSYKEQARLDAQKRENVLRRMALDPVSPSWIIEPNTGEIWFDIVEERLYIYKRHEGWIKLSKKKK